MTTQLTIVWFRQDLRIKDHPALSAACEKGGVLPLFIWDPEDEDNWPPGGASRWWLHHSLQNLCEELATIGLPLIIRKGKTLNVLQEIIGQSGATAVYWNRRYEPYAIATTAQIKIALQKQGIETQSYNGTLLFEPWTIANKQGKPFQVFTPFWKNCMQQLPPTLPLPIPTPHKKTVTLKTESLSSLKLLPKIHWDSGLKETWKPGTAEAEKRLNQFIENGVFNYQKARDIPSIEGISRLSPYLHFGEITSRMIWQAIKTAFVGREAEVECFLRQLGWREFAHHLLYHFSKTPEKPLRQDFTDFPWKNNPIHLKAWQQGKTGYPIVDAGMRQLWKTGWMHNRVRMIVGSFLVKDLLISWTEGSKWFWDTLVDADLANNTLGWQWVGGCGADAAPYFRVFNPMTQGEKFDPEGLYVRQWVPELADVPSKWIHHPWDAPPLILREAGIALGKNYPHPIVDHAIAREEALAAFRQRS